MSDMFEGMAEIEGSQLRSFADRLQRLPAVAEQTVTPTASAAFGRALAGMLEDNTAMKRLLDRLLIRLRLKKPEPKPKPKLPRYQDLIGGRKPPRGGSKRK